MFYAPLDPPVTYPPVGRCIYCGDDGSNGLSDEHIVPYSLNGTQVLPQASCSRCGGITSYIDGFAARSVFYQLRSSAAMRTRTRLPDESPGYAGLSGWERRRGDGPGGYLIASTLVLPRFEPPGLSFGPRAGRKFSLHFTQRGCAKADAFDKFKRSRGAASADVAVSIKPQQFSRMLAKIAHAFAVAQLGLDGFEPLLLDLIHARVVENAPELDRQRPRHAAADKWHHAPTQPCPTREVRCGSNSPFCEFIDQWRARNAGLLGRCWHEALEGAWLTKSTVSDDQSRRRLVAPDRGDLVASLRRREPPAQRLPTFGCIGDAGRRASLMAEPRAEPLKQNPPCNDDKETNGASEVILVIRPIFLMIAQYPLCVLCRATGEIHYRHVVRMQAAEY